MANRRPPLFTRRVFNPLAMRFGISGANTLTTQDAAPGSRIASPPSRSSTPASAISCRRGARPTGCGTCAPRAVTPSCAAPTAPRVRATEIPVAERPPVIAVYQERTGRGSVSHFKALPDPADHPVFRIERRA
jgi:hypothetical protein